MVLKMERIADGQTTILFLSGRIQSEHIAELLDQIATASQKIIVDLDNVKLVDRDVVCFLGNCEVKGIVLRQCPIYIREWIDREKLSKGDF
jgi:ABC-type transporter Mla MlaB component